MASKGTMPVPKAEVISGPKSCSDPNPTPVVPKSGKITKINQIIDQKHTIHLAKARICYKQIYCSFFQIIGHVFHMEKAIQLSNQRKLFQKEPKLRNHVNRTVKKIRNAFLGNIQVNIIN